MGRPPPRVAVTEGDVVLIRARVRAVYTDSVTVRILNVEGSGFAQLGVAPAAIDSLSRGDIDVPPITWR